MLLLIVATTVWLSSSMMIISNAYAQEDILPPKKQMANGTPINEITCKEGLELAFKNSDKSPICVRERTGAELADRNWITVEFLNVQFFTEKEEYSIGEPITITMKNLGPGNLWSSTTIGFDIMNEDNQFVKSWSGGYMGSAKFVPGQEVTYTWNQLHKDDGKQVESGKYIIKSALFHFGILHNSSKIITITDTENYLK